MISTYRKRRLLKILQELYPNPKSELNFGNSYELVIAVVLSAQCTDKKVNEVTPLLFSYYPDFATLSTADLADIEKILRPINYFRTKSLNVVNLSRQVMLQFGGNLPLTFTELTSLPGVGKKTANVVLNELNIAHTLPVDTHVYRLSLRLALSEGNNVTQVEDDLCHLFPTKVWRTLHHSLILHGRSVCKAIKPLCHKCKLLSLCQYGQNLQNL
jgi:endonuclease-3